MIGYMLVLVVAEQVLCQADYNKLDSAFQLKTAVRKVVTLPDCNGVNGTTSGCSECYLCTDPTIVYYQSNGTKIDTFLLKDDKCHSTNICCISQYDFLLGERSSSECGKANPSGYPRRRKPSPRANLPGEYPWRAWIYKRIQPTKPLCSATYIHPRTLVTLASCVGEFAAEALSVAFVRGSDTLHVVENVVLHHEYVAEGHINDIAAVILSPFSPVPGWVRASCFPPAPPVHAAACQAVSANDQTINSVIPLRESCSVSALHASRVCAVAPRNDYAPELGAGLYCVQQYGNQPAYVFYGIAQKTTKDSITLYTNISSYRSWLEKTLGISLF